MLQQGTLYCVLLKTAKVWKVSKSADLEATQ